MRGWFPVCFGLPLMSGALQFNLGLLFPITAEEEGTRVIAPVYVSSLTALVSEINMLNSGWPSVVYQTENLADAQQSVAEFRCPNVTIDYQIIDTLGDFSRGLETLEQVRARQTLHFVIGPFRSSVTVPVSYLTSTDKIPVISPGATSLRLSDTAVHKYFTRFIVSDEVVALSLIQFLRTQSYTRCVVIYLEDDYGSAFKDSIFLQNLETGSEIEFVFIPYAADQSGVSMDSAIMLAAESKINIFFTVGFTEDAIQLISLASEQGLTGPERLWIFSDGVLDGKDVSDHLVSTQNEHLLDDFEGAFLLRSTALVPSTEEYTEVFKSRINSLLGLNDTQREVYFDKLNENLGDVEILEAGLLINENAMTKTMFAYDSMLAIRQVVDVFVYDEQSQTCAESIEGLDGDVFQTMLMELSENQVLRGVTGEIKFEDGSGSRSIDSGVVELIRMVSVGEGLALQDSREGLFQTGWEFTTESLGRQGSRPLETDPPETVHLNKVPDEVILTIRVVAGVILLTILYIGHWVLINSDLQLVSASQPFFMMAALGGVFVLVLSVFLLNQDQDAFEPEQNDMRCNLPYFLISSGLTMIYAALLFKLLRFFAFTEKRIEMNRAGKHEDNFGFRFWVVVLANVVIYTVCYALSPFKFEVQTLLQDDFGQTTESFGICVLDSERGYLPYYCLGLFHLLLYLFGGYVVTEARHYSADFQDSFSVAFSLFIQIQMSILIVPVLLAIESQERTVYFLLQSLAICLLAVVLLYLLFAQKIWRVRTGDVQARWVSLRRFPISNGPASHDSLGSNITKATKDF